MVQSALQGKGPILLPKMPAASPAWRGLSLQGNGFQTIAQSTGNDAIVFDGDPIDTDGIQSVAPYTASGWGVTVPAGSAGVVPVGMAGLWRVSGTVLLASDLTSNPFKVVLFGGILVNDTGPGAQHRVKDVNHLSTGLPPVGTIRPRGDIDIVPDVLSLAEGDTVWFVVSNESDGSMDTLSAGGIRLLMEYLGPAPAAGSGS